MCLEPFSKHLYRFCKVSATRYDLNFAERLIPLMGKERRINNRKMFLDQEYRPFDWFALDIYRR